ncbi:hypothetical protein FH972_010605 [Carpinus fangiana]|uniref:Uncharacterized protein n=1 Tax=Carpinus fangiana TaxID=176857 RepID=A0A660KUU5_9ROSI|nr:hypothetical protein FH972_010605 [Carpinus fangiana]
MDWISNSSSWWLEGDELSEMVSDHAELSVSQWAQNWNLDKRERERRRESKGRDRDTPPLVTQATSDIECAVED